MHQKFYDVFITHTHEDHGEFVSGLLLALKKSGLRVWYLNTELKLKTSVTISITNALKQSRYGIVIISPMYLSKNWALKELGTLMDNEKIEDRILLVLCQVPVKMLKEKKSPLADKHTISSRRGMNHVLAKVLDVVAMEPADITPTRKGKKVRGNRDNEENRSSPNVGIIVLGGGADV